MTLPEAQARIGQPVRIHPRAGHGGGHYGRANLVGVDGRRLVVKPWGRHRQTERMRPEDVVAWKAKERAE